MSQGRRWRWWVGALAGVSATFLIPACSGHDDDGAEPDAAVETDAGADPDSGLAAGAIQGMVTVRGGGTLGGVEVSTTPASGFAITSPDGQYALRGVPSGPYVVTASRTGYVEIEKSADVQPSGTVYVDFVLETVEPDPGRIEGHVTDAASGDPIPGATVTTDPVTTVATAGVDGTYAIEAVAPGDYAVSATVEGYEAAADVTATVESGRTATVDFQLVALVTYASRCAECHSTPELLLADLAANPPPEPPPAENTGEG